VGGIKSFWEKVNKKVLGRILWLMCLVAFLVTFYFVRQYRNVALYYNAGNRYYKTQLYETAESYYKQALWENHTKRQECKIRINLALAIVKPITPMVVNSDNLDEMIARLEYAIEILVENECAHMDDSNGHSKKAQTLKEEIEAYIEELKEQNPPPESSDENKSQDQNDQNSQNNDDKNSGNQDMKNQEEQKNKEQEQKEKEQREKEQREKEQKEREEKEKQAKEQELREIMEATEKEGEDQRNRALQTYDKNGYSWSSEDRNW